MRVKRLIRYLGEEGGQDMAEYAIALAVISGALVLVVGAVRTDITSIWSQAIAAIRNLNP